MIITALHNIPTTILTGFLGAGKTTFLNQLLQQGVPVNSLVLVNDFGEINIDADLIEYQDEHIIRLNNGCVCCTLGGSMAEKLAEIGRLTPAPSALYIETSGVANASKVADMIRVSKRFALENVWCFVNVSLAQHHSDDKRVNTVWEQQIKNATQLVLNRLASKQETPYPLEQLIKQSSAQIHYDFSSAVSQHTTNTTQQNTEPTHTSRSEWHSFSFESENQIHIDKLKAMIVQASTSLYRAKGLITTAPYGKTFVLQYTGGQWNLTPSAKKSLKNQLVFIGEAHGLEKLKNQLHTSEASHECI